MKNIILLGSIYMFAIVAFAQQCSEDAGFGQISLSEVENRINNSQGTKSRRDIIAAVVSSQRMDLIKLCFENPRTGFDAAPLIAKLPDSSFKESLVVMMLKTDSNHWPRESKFLAAGSTKAPIPLMIDPFVAVLRKHLPDLPLEDDLLLTRAARMKLASELQAAIDREAVVPGAHPIIEPVVPPQAGVHPPIATPVTPETTQSPTTSASAEKSANVPGSKSDRPVTGIVARSPSTLPFVWIASIVTAVGLLWILFKKRA